MGDDCCPAQGRGTLRAHPTIKESLGRAAYQASSHLLGLRLGNPLTFLLSEAKELYDLFLDAA
jgi:hypothetical protein